MMMAMGSKNSGTRIGADYGPSSSIKHIWSKNAKLSHKGKMNTTVLQLIVKGSFK
jgi:hypothetical protein